MSLWASVWEDRAGQSGKIHHFMLLRDEKGILLKKKYIL